jgi:hypothetical protein
MKCRTPGNLLITDCTVSHSKHDSTASESRLLGLATPSRVASELFTTPLLQSPTRPDASGKQQRFNHPIIRAIIMRIPLWTQALRYV